MIRKILNLKPGNAVTRQYRNARTARTFCAANAVVATYLGFKHAKAGSNMVFIDMVNLVIFGKVTEKTHSTMKNLKPEYDQIVTRAKTIFAKAKK